MIKITRYDDVASLPVFRLMDKNDFTEAEIIRGAVANPIQLWADWRAVEGFKVFSLMAYTGQAATTPFAVFGLSHTGQSGVAAAALLARDHRKFRWPLARLAATIRAQLPAEARAQGIHRIEARAWAGHPTASNLLIALGFTHEADMGGFGPAGSQTYRQFALILPEPAAPPATQNPIMEGM